jgi:membrane protein
MEAQEGAHNSDSSPLPAPDPTAGATSTHSQSSALPEIGTTPEKADEQAVRVTTTVTHTLQVAETGAENALVNLEKREIHTIVADAQQVLLAEKHEVLKLATDAQHLLTAAEEYTAVKSAITDAATFGEFWLKFLNDWAFNFASGLAYHLLMAMFPIVIAVGATTGFIEGGLSPNAQSKLVSSMGNVFPAVLGQNVLAPALVLLRKDAGFLGVIAIVLALYSGSRLFSSMENCFAIIYHTPTRSFWRQNLMALVMLLIFLLLIPIMLLASSIGLDGLLGSLIASLLLFQAIYMIVPNQKISLRKSWRGTLVAAVALQIYVLLFPFYIRHFLGSYTGNTGFAIILLLFFFYFALILLIGAEVNAFYAEGVRAKPQNIAEMVHMATLATDKAELLELARQRARRNAMKP